MGIKKALTLVLAVVFMLLFSSCDFVSPRLNLYGIKIAKIKATLSFSYFLSCDGVLYCNGADSDASAFAIFKNEKKGIVAENVKDFGIISAGGYYIDYENDLYIWHRDNKPIYNYYQKRNFSLLLNDVRFARFGYDKMIYIDMQNNLYLVGKFCGEEYNISNPKLLAENVLSADIYESFVLWYTEDGTINGFGTPPDVFNMDEIKANFLNKPIQDIQILNESILFLSNGELWYYGDIKTSVFEDVISDNMGFHQVATDVVEVCVAYCGIVILDSNGNVRLWGRYISNGPDEQEEPIYEYYNDYIIAKNAKSIYAEYGCICYVDDEFNSKIYHNGGWTAFYGNSSRDEYVGLNHEPVTWIKNGRGDLVSDGK